MDDLQARAKATADSKRLRANIKALNREFKYAKKEGVDAVNFYKTARVQIEQLTKSESKRGLANLGKASRNAKTAQQLLELTDKLLSSKWATAQGREEIYRKSFKTLHTKTGATKAQALLAYDVFNNETYQKLKEITALPSEQIIKTIRKSGKREKGQTLEEFIEKRFYKNLNKIQQMSTEEQKQYWAKELNRWATRDTSKIKKKR